MAFIILKLPVIGTGALPEILKNADGSLVEFADKKKAKIYVIEHDLEKQSFIIDTTDPQEYAHCFMVGAVSATKRILSRTVGKIKEASLSDKPPVSKFN